MATLEQEIRDRFKRLDQESRRVLLSELADETIDANSSDGDWLDNLIALHGELREQYGRNFASNVVDTLRQLREERSEIRW